MGLSKLRLIEGVKSVAFVSSSRNLSGHLKKSQPKSHSLFLSSSIHHLIPFILFPLLFYQDLWPALLKSRRGTIKKRVFLSCTSTLHLSGSSNELRHLQGFWTEVFTAVLVRFAPLKGPNPSDTPSSPQSVQQAGFNCGRHSTSSSRNISGTTYQPSECKSQQHPGTGAAETLTLLLRYIGDQGRNATKPIDSKKEPTNSITPWVSKNRGTSIKLSTPFWHWEDTP